CTVRSGTSPSQKCWSVSPPVPATQRWLPEPRPLLSITPPALSQASFCSPKWSAALSEGRSPGASSRWDPVRQPMFLPNRVLWRVSSLPALSPHSHYLVSVPSRKEFRNDSEQPSNQPNDAQQNHPDLGCQRGRAGVGVLAAPVWVRGHGGGKSTCAARRWLPDRRARCRAARCPTDGDPAGAAGCAHRTTADDVSGCRWWGGGLLRPTR